MVWVIPTHTDVDDSVVRAPFLSRGGFLLDVDALVDGGLDVKPEDVPANPGHCHGLPVPSPPADPRAVDWFRRHVAAPLSGE
ncbi:hypothetical protein [Actinophytocola sp.]|uniref:hypothetical protein n=1 Tax=Actinophytocola sp. TaxID=1872138 RepID=UPI003D6A85D8